MTSLWPVRNPAPLRPLRGTLVAHPPALHGRSHINRVRVPCDSGLHHRLRLPDRRVVDAVHRVVRHEPTPPGPVPQHLCDLEAATPPVPVVVAVPTPRQLHNPNVRLGSGDVQ